MRLWHSKLLPVLPDLQLKSQWRELNSIYANQNKHILINYVYSHPKSYLKKYSDAVLDEMHKRGFVIHSMDKYNAYFNGVTASTEDYPEHNQEYLIICVYNLYEKYIRHQKDFSDSQCQNIIDILKMTVIAYEDRV